MAGRKKEKIQSHSLSLLPLNYKLLWNKQINSYFLVYIGILILFVPLLGSCSTAHDTEQKTSTNQLPQTEATHVIKQEVVTYEMAGYSIVKPVVIAADVTEVTNGDTIKVRIDGRDEIVHMLLINTPKIEDQNNSAQPWGIEASNFTKQELTGRQVGLEFDISDRNQNGQLLAYVWLDKQLFNGTLLDQGFARVALNPPNTKYSDLFQAIQERARTGKSGIWSIENYVTDTGFNEEAVTPKKVAAQPTEPQPVSKTQPKPAPKQKPDVAPQEQPSPQPVPPKPPRTRPPDGELWHVKTE